MNYFENVVGVDVLQNRSVHHLTKIVQRLHLLIPSLVLVGDTAVAHLR